MTNETLKPCGECGMPVRPNEYHPYAACLMFKGCCDSGTVRMNLGEIRRNTCPEPEAREAVAWMIVADDGHCRGLYSAQDKDHAEAAIYRDKEIFPDSRLAPLFTTPPDDEARRLLADWLLTEPEECRLDHNGMCQAHFVEDGARCTVKRTRAYLAQTDGEGE